MLWMLRDLCLSNLCSEKMVKSHWSFHRLQMSAVKLEKTVLEPVLFILCMSFKMSFKSTLLSMCLGAGRSGYPETK